MAENKIDWNKIVSESNGKNIFLPDIFKKQTKEWLELREEYNKYVSVMAKKEITLNMALNNLLFDLRKYLEKNGREDIYLKDLGFDTNALLEEKFIVNIIDPNQNQIPLR